MKRKNNKDEQKIKKVKEQLSIDIIKHNHIINNLLRQMGNSIRTCSEISKNFTNQRELIARSKMIERVINSSIRMLDSNKLQLWMIDDRTIQQDNE